MKASIAGASSVCAMAARAVLEESCLTARPKAQSFAAWSPSRPLLPLASSTPPAKRQSRSAASKGRAPECSAARPNASSAAGAGSHAAPTATSLCSPSRSEASGMPSGSRGSSAATASESRRLATSGSLSKTLGRESPTRCAIRCKSSEGTSEDCVGEVSSDPTATAALSSCSHAAKRARIATVSSKSPPRRRAPTWPSRRTTSPATARRSAGDVATAEVSTSARGDMEGSLAARWPRRPSRTEETPSMPSSSCTARTSAGASRRQPPPGAQKAATAASSAAFSCTSSFFNCAQKRSVSLCASLSQSVSPAPASAPPPPPASGAPPSLSSVAACPAAPETSTCVRLSTSRHCSAICAAQRSRTTPVWRMASATAAISLSEMRVSTPWRSRSWATFSSRLLRSRCRLVRFTSPQRMKSLHKTAG
mmetsp:Transcript_11243/g.31663  ORF Transcript_11243/g.31663 Transcript_11243/m.31663 type:complete len:423 (+) Transcript_11243:467-1735(+)